jgi:hypothetical protein
MRRPSVRTQTTPYDWSATPASWTELGQRVLFEVYCVAAEKMTASGAVETTQGDMARALDRAMRATTPMSAVTAWAADKASDIPVEVAR